MGSSIHEFAGLNAKAQRGAERRKEFFFFAFLRVPLRLCVKTGLALVAPSLLCAVALRFLMPVPSR